MYIRFSLLVLLYIFLSLARTQSSATFQNVTASNIRVDTGVFGPPLEEVHYYYDQWPIGLAISQQGRIFVCYTRGDYVRRH